MQELRIGIVGVGGMGGNHVESVKVTPRARLSAICDIKKDLADNVAAKNGAKAFYDADTMFKSGEIDAVIIATPHYDHTPLTVMALDSGIHVLTEKPIAVHKKDAAKMIEAHRRNPKLQFAAMFQMRTEPWTQKLKSLINSGELGNIYRINWIITNWFRSQAYYNSGGWRATWKGEGGGVLLNQCPHQIDLYQWFFGMPSKVRGFCQIGKYHNIEVEDNVTSYFEYPDGKTAVFITSTGEAPGTNRLEISCDRGRLVFEDGKLSLRRTELSVKEFLETSKESFATPPVWEIQIPVAQSAGSPHQKIIENFVCAILDGAALIAPASEGINSVELANSMLYSSMKNCTVDMPLDQDAFEKALAELVRTSKYVKPEAGANQNADLSKSFNKG
ncbi:MAG: oxidoreductase [Lentisphaerae bacterium GWF2_52_8]|nr:MAG: oxidoreductase [Lentisphaerae bacterium GWF2_52_8]